MGLHQWIWDFGEENHADSLPLQTAKKKLLDMVENLHSTLFTLKEVLVKIKYIRHCIQFDLASFCLVCMFVTDVLSLSKARPDPQLSLVLLRESEEVAVVASILKNPWWTNSVVPKGNSKDQHIQHVVNLWLWFFVRSTMRWHGDLSLFWKATFGDPEHYRTGAPTQPAKRDYRDIKRVEILIDSLWKKWPSQKNNDARKARTCRFASFLAVDFGGTAQPCQEFSSVPDATEDIMIPYVYNIIPALYDNPNVAWMKETQVVVCHGGSENHLAVMPFREGGQVAVCLICWFWHLLPPTETGRPNSFYVRSVKASFSILRINCLQRAP